MRCLPADSCFGNLAQVREGEESSLKGKVCANWRTVPALLITTSLIVALVSAITWGSTGLSVTYGVGAGLSVYFLYLAYQYRHLQSLERSASVLAAENDKLTQALTRLDRILGGFDLSKQNLDTSLGQLATKVSELKGEFGEQLALVSTTAGKLAEVFNAANAQAQHQVLGQLQGQQQALQQQVGELKGIKDGFVSALGELQTEVGKLGGVASSAQALATVKESIITAVARLERAANGVVAGSAVRGKSHELISVS